ncbi:ribosome hibernation-promoting factor, HPF/YfiA family [Rubellimicrobium aerolatum]|uniref:Ribosome hibernation promoting factor n=1 Tax=Rubellimicrobium aerolatum TaxID=490979 RepID=A0ABW0SAA3_9RHOB|nr:ribosome-associated translation inhibitor RaiA [Rubellimicrobium aerolatum]MBP1805220.1 ribosomal subunit interface protein [Rubellimicrobium aerolatum]
MRIRVSGKDIDIGESLQAHVNQALTESTAKYAGRPTDATVTFSRDGFGLACEVFVHLSTGLVAQANGMGADCYAAFEAARERMAKQLRRHKRRLKDHHKERPNPVDTVPAGSFVLAPFDEDVEDDEDHHDESVNGDAGPTIIAETELRVPSLSVAEAVLQMDLQHAPVLVFRNEKGGAINVVYRREDGNIGWIDPRVESGGSSAQG